MLVDPSPVIAAPPVVDVVQNVRIASEMHAALHRMKSVHLLCRVFPADEVYEYSKSFHKESPEYSPHSGDNNFGFEERSKNSACRLHDRSPHQKPVLIDCIFYIPEPT